MNKLEKQIRDCLESLEKTVNNLVSFFKNEKDFNQLVYTYWTVKDVLGHVTFWDESFTRNLQNFCREQKGESTWRETCGCK